MERELGNLGPPKILRGTKQDRTRFSPFQKTDSKYTDKKYEQRFGRITGTTRQVMVGDDAMDTFAPLTSRCTHRGAKNEADTGRYASFAKNESTQSVYVGPGKIGNRLKLPLREP